jgi:hypothetical protein
MISEDLLDWGPRHIMESFSFPDEMEVWRVPAEPVLDEWKRVSEVRVLLLTTNCRIRPSTFLAREFQIGDQQQEQVRWDLFVQVRTDIGPTDEVHIITGRFAGKVYTVEAVLGPRTYEIGKRCSLKSLR